MKPRDIALRYGLNPHQSPARAYASDHLPFEVRNGAPGAINLLDALNAWQLVRELRRATGLPAAASFKHVSPAGAAVAVPMSEEARRAARVEDLTLSPLAVAYARARGADRVSSFGDLIALSERVDADTARLIQREVSDGVIAPGYEPKALELLGAKRGGRYLVLEVDPTFEPGPAELRDVFGVTIEQRRNDRVIDESLLANVVTQKKAIEADARRDLLVGLIALKYTQSNSVAFAAEGQVVGVGAGQQSRIHCTRLAAEKAELWWLRRHPAALELPLRPGMGRPERDNAVDGFLRGGLTEPEERAWAAVFRSAPSRLDQAERRRWLGTMPALAYVSDAFLPFRDNVDRAFAAGARHIAQPGGSARDGEVIAACDEHGMVMAMTGLRLFHH